MTDVITQQRLEVSTDGTAGPYITVTTSQVDEVTRILTGKGIFHWVDEYAVSLNGEPEVMTINLGRAGDARAVQNVLDESR